MATFNVYFRQVNQTRYTIEAKSKDVAVKMAEKQWKEENNPPALICVETLNRTAALLSKQVKTAAVTRSVHNSANLN